jgi:hypothetical protein
LKQFFGLDIFETIARYPDLMIRFYWNENINKFIFVASNSIPDCLQNSVTTFGKFITNLASNDRVMIFQASNDVRLYFHVANDYPIEGHISISRIRLSDLA